MQVIKLAAGEGSGWGEFRMPGADRPVRLRQLHQDPESRASVVLVDFPAGWRRDEVGHYRCAEEFLLLSGALSVSGVAYSAGDYGYVPPRTVRSASFSGPGCLAVAYFSGAVVWTDGEPAVPPEQEKVVGAPVGQLRGPGPGVPGSAEVLDPGPLEPLDSDADLIALASREWVWVAAGRSPVAFTGPVLVRRWG